MKNYNPWLDLFRGFAALMVCIGHIRNAFWVDYGEIQVKLWWHAPVYLFTSLGHQAVIIFFVLSGFLVGGGVLMREKNFSWVDYFSARLIRLWLVLIPALFFTMVCDFLTLKLLPNAFDGVLSSLWNSGATSSESFSLRVFFANVLFLQTIAVPVFGSNGPLWSLANEFWYYVLFPLTIFALGLAGNFVLFKRLIMFFMFVGTVVWLPQKIIIYFVIWLMGVICFLIIKKFSPKVNIISICFFFGIFVCSLGITKILSKELLLIWSDIAVGVSFSILLICVSSHQAPWRHHGLLGVVIKKISDFSYSLYLFHFPLVVLLAVIMVGTIQLQPNFASVGVIVGITGLCFAVAAVSWFLFERHNDHVRCVVNRMMQRLPLLRTKID